jgi:chemotaxis protein CheX
MPESLQVVLHAAAAATFETFTFLSAEDAPGTGEGGVAMVTAAVDFTGPRRGRLALRVPSTLLPTIAANMLGDDDAPPSSLQHDALGELANVICGAVLPSLGGPSAVFSLASPRTGRPWRELVDATGQQCVASISLDLEGARADIVWLADGAPVA